MPKEIEVTQRTHGYNHTRLQGTCSPDVTVEDIEKRFHDYFGGRETWVKDGHWGTVVHGND